MAFFTLVFLFKRTGRTRRARLAAVAGSPPGRARIAWGGAFLLIGVGVSPTLPAAESLFFVVKLAGTARYARCLRRSVLVETERAGGTHGKFCIV